MYTSIKSATARAPVLFCELPPFTHLTEGRNYGSFTPDNSVHVISSKIPPRHHKARFWFYIHLNIFIGACGRTGAIRILPTILQQQTADGVKEVVAESLQSFVLYVIQVCQIL